MRRLRVASPVLPSLILCRLGAVVAGQTAANPSLMQVAKLTASDRAFFNQIGLTSAISDDTAVVAGLASVGQAHVFVKGSNGWSSMTQTATLVASHGSASLGGSVGMVATRSSSAHQEIS